MVRVGTPWKGDAPVHVGVGTAGLSNGMGEVTMACAGQATARAGFRDTLNLSVSGWAGGQGTVIRPWGQGLEPPAGQGASG